MTGVRRIQFTVLPLAHEQFKCTRCGARMPKGDKAVVLHQEGAVEFQHDGRCPKLGTRHPRFTGPRVVQ